MLTILPLEGVIISTCMQFLALGLDHHRHSLGKTVFWPKVLDASLFLCWLSFMVVLLILPAERVRWVRLYALLIVLGALGVSLLACMLLGMPWAYQIVVDLVDEELHVCLLRVLTERCGVRGAGWDRAVPHQQPPHALLLLSVAARRYVPTEGQSELATEKQRNLKQLCCWMTVYAVLVLCFMWTANALNTFLNTELAEDNVTLTHESGIANILVGVLIPSCFCLLGGLASPIVAKMVVKRMASMQAAEGRTYSSAKATTFRL